MIKETIKKIENTLKNYNNPIVAFSGGKDGFVVAHMCNTIMPNIKMVCELSFYFDKQKKNIFDIAKKHGFNVEYKSSLSDDWLIKNKHIIFSEISKFRAWSFAMRQQNTVKKYVKTVNADLAIFGRRKDENCVPKELYYTKNGWQYHPICDWKETDVWNYFKYVNEPKPYIYTTRFGDNMGNAPFYSLKRKNMTLLECWDIINEVDGNTFFYDKFK